MYKTKSIPIYNWNDDEKPLNRLYTKPKTSLSNTDLLACIIKSGIPGATAHDIAREILHKYNNSFQELRAANISELIKFKGIGKKTALQIIAVLEIGKRGAYEQARTRAKITSSKDAFNILYFHFPTLDVEYFFVLYMDRANKVIKVLQISQGGLSGTVADPKVILKNALLLRASGLILGHNHPSGNIQPSEADIRLTKKIQNGCEFIDISCLDHIIIDGTDASIYYSFADHNKI